MYGIPQAGQISHDALVKHPEPYVYHTSIKNLGPWTHVSRTINFTLIVNDFGLNYLGKEHAVHLKSALGDKYKKTTEWEEKLYIGISLNWDYEKGTIQISMKGYVHTALHSFQHKKTKRPQDSP